MLGEGEDLVTCGALQYTNREVLRASKSKAMAIEACYTIMVELQCIVNGTENAQPIEPFLARSEPNQNLGC